MENKYGKNEFGGFELTIPDDAVKNYAVNNYFNPCQKFKNGTSYKPSEMLVVNGICNIDIEQPIHCYRNYDYKITRNQLISLCEACPHCIVRRIDNYDKGKMFEQYSPKTTVSEAEAFVYFITDDEYIKIGFAVDVKRRLKELQTANARWLSVACVLPCVTEEEAHNYENLLHQRFRKYKTYGEWFFRTDELNVLIEFLQNNVR